RDRQGRLVTCEHDSRRVTRTEYDGTITVLADRYEGKRLNSPNDIVVKSDDSIWFTDPPFGILWNYEGHVDKPELPTNVYRIDGKTGELTVVTDEVPRPNGLCFSPDEKRLYVVVSGATPREIWVFDVVDNGTKLSDRRLFVNAAPGIPDGMRCDREGNLWCGWGGGEGQDGVALFSDAGRTSAFRGTSRSGPSRRRPNPTFATADHYVLTSPGSPAPNTEVRSMIESPGQHTGQQGIVYFGVGDARRGIVHSIGPEQGLTLPGITLVCGDSHTATHGAFGALAFGIGSTEVEHVMATQTLWQKKPKVLRITVEGRLPDGVNAKDVILAIIARIGAGGGV